MMRFRIVAILIIISFVVGVSAFSQVGPPVSAGHFATFSELLKDHHIERTTPVLVVALQNPDSYVRGLAALVLAEDKAISAIPAIKEALTAEKVLETRVNIALALAQLGEGQGFKVLKDACNDNATPAHLRMYSAGYLLELHDESAWMPF